MIDSPRTRSARSTLAQVCALVSSGTLLGIVYGYTLVGCGDADIVIPGTGIPSRPPITGTVSTTQTPDDEDI